MQKQDKLSFGRISGTQQPRFRLKGVIEDRMGFFPAAFAHQVRAGDQVFRCNRTFIGCKEQGQITLKEGQICVSSEGEHSGFIRVASGKKRGFVPCDVLEII
eukprot:superscaffoldBa00004541_g19059